ncbi:MAG: ABC transporter permease [Acidobacteriota bacterium]
MNSPMLRFARWLVCLLAERDRREDLVGDLEELHREYLELDSSRFAAARALGDALVTAIYLLKERLRELLEPARDQLLGFGGLGLDLKLALRLTRKRPLLNLTALGVLTAALCLVLVGLTFVNGLLFSRPPYEGEGTLLRIEAEMQSGGLFLAPPRTIEVLREEAKSLEFLAAHRYESLYLAHRSGEIEQLDACLLAPEALRYLPVAPVAGRLLTLEDASPGAPPAVMLREGLWRSLEGSGAGPEGALGTFNLAGVERQVVGVVPDDFQILGAPDLWIPLPESEWIGESPRTTERFGLFGRLPDGASKKTLLAELERAAALVSEDVDGPKEGAGFAWVARPLSQVLSSSEMRLFSVLMGVALLILLVMAFNVGNLFLVRFLERSRELALRAALGATRSRLVTQQLLEVALVVCAAAGLSFGLTRWFLARLLASSEGESLGSWITMSLDSRVAAAAAGVVLALILAAGLAPALWTTRPAPQATLQAASRGGRSALGRFSGLLTVVQMALAVALVSAALVTGRGAWSHWNPDLGLPRGEILTAQWWGVDSLNDGRTAQERRDHDAEMWRQSLERVRRIPGVESAGGASWLPGSGEAGKVWAEVEGAGAQAEGATASMHGVHVRPGFFETLRIEPLAGRLIEQRDLLGGAAPVAVVNQLFVDQYLGGAQPLGRRIRVLGERSEEGPWHEIIGLVPNLGMSLFNPEQGGGFFLPMRSVRPISLAVRVEGPPSSYAVRVRQAVAEVNPEIILLPPAPLEQVGRDAFVSMVAWTGSLTTLGGGALVLSLVGLFVLTSLVVGARTAEIGVRVALGATPREIFTLISRWALIQLALGALAGGLLARWLLLGLSRIDRDLPLAGNWELPGVTLLLVGVGLLACWLPTRRALGVSPREAFSEE